MGPNIEQMVINKSQLAKEALIKIDKNAQGLLFVLDDEGKLCGTLTDGDIRRALIKDMDINTNIFKFMKKKFISLSVDAKNHEITNILAQNEISHIPLVDSDNRVVDYASLSRTRRIPIMEPYLCGNELAYVTDCIKTNWLSSQGKYVLEFEGRFSDLCKGAHALSVCNGTAALHTALIALEIGPGDEVIVPDITFAATANAILHAGAVPVFVDVSSEHWGIDSVLIESAVTSKTKAIIPVHLYGHSCDMDPILEISRRYDLRVIEDCAQALGATYKGKPVGSMGDAGCFSFFGNKIITTGEGGMVVFRDQEAYKRATIIRDHGMSIEKKYWHEVVGYNYRLTNIQAAIGLGQLEQFDEVIKKKRGLEQTYIDSLSDCSGVTFPPSKKWSENICWLFTVLIDTDKFGDRDSLVKKFHLNGIDTRPVFYPLHQMPVFKKYVNTNHFPVADQISSKGISLPSSLNLEKEDVKKICEVFLQFRSIKKIRTLLDTIGLPPEN
jgi:perosamine synthetase